MTFKIGDKIKIDRHTFIINLDDTTKVCGGLFSTMPYEGTVVATNCQLKNNSECTLLVKIGFGYVFVSLKNVNLAEPPKYYAYIFGNIKMEITKKQYDEIKKAEIVLFGNTNMGVLEVENEEI